MFKRSFLALFIILSFSLFSKEKVKNPTVLISIDGFRYDYPDLFDLKFLKELRSKSVSQTPLAPVYPSKTFPNHYSMITGAYPDEHGIIGNFFYDKETRRTYAINNVKEKRDPSWYKKEPVWVELEEKGIKTASYFWPASDVSFRGICPTYLHKWSCEASKKATYSVILNEGIRWLKLPQKERPQLILLYLSQVDEAGHHFGPKSIETKEACEELDNSMNSFYEKLITLPFNVNLIVVSDHGMVEINPKKVFYLEDFIDFNKVHKSIGSGNLVHLYYTDEQECNKAYQKLSQFKQTLYSIYKKNDLPESYNLKKSSHTGDLVVKAHFPAYIMADRSRPLHIKGNHGFDPKKVKEMNGIYYGIGKDLEKSKIEVRETKDIYKLLL